MAMGIERSRLKDHKFKKGTFVTPLNNALGSTLRFSSWIKDRMPEYVWLAFILDKLGRREGLEIAIKILEKLYEIDNNVVFPGISQILSMSENKQKEFCKYVETVAGKDALSSLTILFPFKEYPVFVKYFADFDLSYNDKIKKISSVITKIYDHQSHDATDVRFLVIFYLIVMQKKLYLPAELISEFNRYPILDHADEEMRSIRPAIRATEMSLIELEIKNNKFLHFFWERISNMTECEMFAVNCGNNVANSKEYIESLEKIFRYLARLFSLAAPLDNKMLVLLGISTFSYKRIREVVEHNLFNTISGRGTTRCLVECYIMMKYLLKQEKNKPTVWEDFQYYGIGQLKLILDRYREASASSIQGKHFDSDYIELIVNEYMFEEFIDMDTSYFNKENVRSKAIQVGEKDLFGLIYDYDSAYVHGFWGAIRESSLIKCNTPAHQYHCVPDFGDKQKLPNIWQDCVSIMNKIIFLLNETYGIPEALITEVENFEK